MKSATLKIDLDSILYNYRHLKCKYKKNIIAVLKDDAYGLGLLKVANKLKDEENIVFAISSLEEIILLRNNNINNDILYLNVFDIDDIETINKYNITAVVSNFEQLELVKNNNLKFHLKFNTGMNRIGFFDYEISQVISKINKDNYNLKGVMTHIADDDKQHKSYYKFVEIIKKINYKNLMIHCFASNSLTTYKDEITNYIRVGIKLYGIGDKNMFLHNTISLTFAIGSALAAVAGVLLCSAYPTLTPYTGSMPGIKAFVAAVFGGIGSIPGAFLGGILLGVIENMSKAYISSQLSDAIVFAVLIVVLLVKPSGLLGKNIQEKV